MSAASRSQLAPEVTIGSGTTRLLMAGVIAGPLFLVVSTIQALTRDGFDITKVAFSSLSVGAYGWIQVTNFVVAGLLSIACATGIRRVVHSGRGSTWGPRLLVVFGLGQVAAGLFTTDPAMGFPPGTPDGLPERFTWHAIVHNISAPVAFLSAAVACVVFAARFAAAGDSRWRSYSMATAVLAVLVALPPEPTSAGLRLATSTALVYLWLALLAIKLTNQPAEGP